MNAADPATTTVATYEGRPLANPDEDIYDQGLAFDLETLVDRRRVLKLLGLTGLGAGIFAVAGCAPTGTASAGASASASASAAAASAAASAAATADAAACAVIPEETGGPYPADGSNGPDVLNQSGVVRKDIRASFGGMSGTAAGVPLTIKLLIQDVANGCAPLPNAAVYLWHCDREGRYSLYSQGATDQNYLRGVQAAGSDGVVTFTSIFPACYQGRWPHIHFEVYPNLAAATDDANKIATSQIALPEDSCNAVYATDGYASSIRTMSGVSLDRDNVFGEDNGARQLGTMSGSIADGLTVSLDVPVQTA